METTTKISAGKNKMDEALLRAKKTSTTIKQSANVVKAAAGQLQVVPGFKDYVVNANFTELISKKTGKVQQIPAGKKKYLIFNDKGERRSISMEDIKASLPKSAVKSEGQSKTEIIISLHKQGKSQKEIAEATGFKYNTVYEAVYKHNILSEARAGKTPKQIAEKYSYGLEAVTRVVNKYINK